MRPPTSINQITQYWAESRGIPTYFANQTTSTNDWAKRLFPATAYQRALYLADWQSAGRGRNQSQWTQSQSGHCLLSTWSFRLDGPPGHLLAPLVGLALYQALATTWPKESFSIKPPNDLFLAQGKLGGLLLELEGSGQNWSLAIGLGLNAFSSPHVDQKTSHLFASETYTLSSWSCFCDLWLQHIAEALQDGSEPILSPKNQKLMLKALQQFPYASIDKIENDGSYWQNGRRYPWREV